MARWPKLAFVVLVLALAPRGARADDLPEQRLACQEEARRNIKGPNRIDQDLYKRVMERRQLFVRDCMALRPRDIEQTGSVRMPIPPKRPPA
jgi:hypothetical protein